MRLHRLLNDGGEMKLNPDVLKEMGIDAPLGSPKADVSKTWMDFDASLPAMPRMPEKKVVLTLRPYTANTKYNWDPVYQKKITVNKNTWRGNPFYELTRLSIENGSAPVEVPDFTRGGWNKVQGYRHAFAE